MTGWIAMTRDSFKHPLFKREPVTEWEAFARLIRRAAWEDTRHRVGDALVDVPRGSFFCTLRELQSEFMWRSDTRVRKFLERLEKERMIERKTNAGKTHVTICNYEEYQSGERKDERKKNAQKTQEKRTKETREQINQDTVDDTREVDPDFFEAVCDAAGVDLSKTTSTYWHGGPAQSHIRTWRNLGLNAEEVLTCIRAVSQQKRDGPPSALKYFDGALRDAAAAKIRPDLTPSNPGERHERPRTAQERAAANHSHVASAWIAEGRRRDQERGLGGSETGSGDPGDFGMDRGQASDAVVSLFPAGSGRDGFGGGGFGLADHSQPIPASGHRGGLR